MSGRVAVLGLTREIMEGSKSERQLFLQETESRNRSTAPRSFFFFFRSPD